MPKPLSDDNWKLTVCAQYQEAMKIPINWAAASLGLPILFLRWGGVQPDGKMLGRLTASAYVSWICLGLSLVCGLLFYWASAKFVKAVCGGYPDSESRRIEATFETIRDGSIVATVLLFGMGLVSALYFLTRVL